MEAQKRERRKNRKQDNDTAVCVSHLCDRICRSSFGLRGRPSPHYPTGSEYVQRTRIGGPTTNGDTEWIKIWRGVR